MFLVLYVLPTSWRHTHFHRLIGLSSLCLRSSWAHTKAWMTTTGAGKKRLPGKPVHTPVSSSGSWALWARLQRDRPQISRRGGSLFHCH